MESLRVALGQLFFLGFPQKEPDRDLLDLVGALKPGGIILFRRNLSDPDQIARLTDALQAASGPDPLFIAVDQEGGRVSRLPEPFTRFPAVRALGRAGSTDLALACAEATARELRAVGINFNFAPVLDVDTNPANPVIGSRSFGPDPDQVATLGLATIEGFRREGLLGLVKHFPGHGDTSHDSHVTLPVVQHPLHRLERIELAPFRSVLRHPRGADALMTAHVLYPALDPSLPATLSGPILTEILRKQMGFPGLVITDDLEMKAISDRFSPEEASLLALQAGADQLLFCHTPSLLPRCLDKLAGAVGKGALPEERIRQSLARVRSLKETHLRNNASRQDRLRLFDRIGCAGHRALAAQAQSFEEGPDQTGPPP